MGSLRNSTSNNILVKIFSILSLLILKLPSPVTKSIMCLETKTARQHFTRAIKTKQHKIQTIYKLRFHNYHKFMNNSSSASIISNNFNIPNHSNDIFDLLHSKLININCFIIEDSIIYPIKPLSPFKPGFLLSKRE